jgi:hypothetical protein
MLLIGAISSDGCGWYDGDYDVYKSHLPASKASFESSLKGSWPGARHTRIIHAERIAAAKAVLSILPRE